MLEVHVSLVQVLTAIVNIVYHMVTVLLVKMVTIYTVEDALTIVFPILEIVIFS